jgi:alpha-tubulin suppressor-like RCC1 family protein
MKISAIFAGENVSYALTEKGLLYGWGEVKNFNY